MFTPTLKSSINIDIKVIQEDKFNYMDDELSKPSVYYVVDPGLTKDSCNPNIDFKGKVIIIASPDDGHWGGGGIRFYQNAEKCWGDIPLLTRMEFE